MAAYRRVYDSPHLQADCQTPGSAPEPYARQSAMGYLLLWEAYCDSTDLLAECKGEGKSSREGNG